MTLYAVPSFIIIEIKAFVKQNLLAFILGETPIIGELDSVDVGYIGNLFRVNI